MKTAAVYDDDGADPFVTDCLAVSLADAGFDVRRRKGADLTGGDGWHDGLDLLAFPGGADRPYAEKLNGVGNASIRRFVKNGGRFLGVCAGAYYACRRIDFTGAEFAVKADRELGLFAGTAVGSLPRLAKPYRTQDLDCAAATPVRFDGGDAHCLYWGGCYFAPDADAAFETLATYASQPPGENIAAVRCRFGEGVVTLVGVHVEVPGEAFDGERRKYVRGSQATASRSAMRIQQTEDERRRLIELLVRG